MAASPEQVDVLRGCVKTLADMTNEYMCGPWKADPIGDGPIVHYLVRVASMLRDLIAQETMPPATAAAGVVARKGKRHVAESK